MKKKKNARDEILRNKFRVDKKKQPPPEDTPEPAELKLSGNVDYMKEILNPEDLKYFNQIKKIWLDKGLEDCPDLNDYCYIATINRKYQLQHEQLSDLVGKAATDLLDLIKDNTDKLSKLHTKLTKLSEAHKREKDTVDLHQETRERAKKYIKDHIGEFTFRCENCNEMVTTNGLPHWAIKKEINPKTKECYYHIFSTELHYLFQQGRIPLWITAFALRTSIMGILLTIKERGLNEPKINIKEEEKKLKEANSKFEGES